MQVWDAAGGEDLLFDADRFGRRELGYIVENGLLQDRLWAALPAAGVQLHCPARVEALEQDEDGVRLRLDDGRRLEAALAVADGAESTLRQLAGIEVEKHDYHQRGVVAYVDSDLSQPGLAAFLPAVHWRCCRWPSAAAPSSGPRPRMKRLACWRWTRTASTANWPAPSRHAWANCVWPRRVRRSAAPPAGPSLCGRPRAGAGRCRTWCTRWPGRA